MPNESIRELAEQVEKCYARWVEPDHRLLRLARAVLAAERMAEDMNRVLTRYGDNAIFEAEDIRDALATYREATR